MRLGKGCVLECVLLLFFGDILVRVGRWNYREWTVLRWVGWLGAQLVMGWDFKDLSG